MSPETLRRILTPEPGTALWRAKEYGIDLTQILEAIQMTPEERVERALSTVRSMVELRENVRIRAR
ncbi:MAG: hypothetical protein JO083_01220 [Candidatus Eremiobacteraeota bacterium]|nr:hypothetical protein [Candidatus Eremiobacteraeota bacterium]